MKKILTALCLGSLAAFGGKSSFSVGDGKVPDFSKYTRLKAVVTKHPREVRSDYSLPGYVIHYYSDGSVETNAIVRISLQTQANTVEKQVADLNATIAKQLVALTNQLAKIVSFSNLCVVAQAQAQAANAKIQGEIEDLEAKVEKYESYKTKYPLLKTVWQAFIDDAQNRIKILQALTGG